MTSTVYNRFGKRSIDVVASIAGLVLLSPFMLAVAVAVKLSSPGPVFFRQVRTGRFGRPFRIFKFRTMIEVAAGCVSSITAGGDSRITHLGRWLRKTKIDELPQLINVARGEMSLVGPRPELPEFTKDYAARYRPVLLARPGITGLAACAYFQEEKVLANLPDKERFYVGEILPRKLELDLRYCEDIRFLSDVRLLAQTFEMLVGTSTRSIERCDLASAPMK